MNERLIEAVGFNPEGWSEGTRKMIDREIRKIVPAWRRNLFERFGWLWPLRRSAWQRGAMSPRQTLVVRGPSAEFKFDGIV